MGQAPEGMDFMESISGWFMREDEKRFGYYLIIGTMWTDLIVPKADYLDLVMTHIFAKPSEDTEVKFEKMTEVATEKASTFGCFLYVENKQYKDLLKVLNEVSEGMVKIQGLDKITETIENRIKNET